MKTASITLTKAEAEQVFGAILGALYDTTQSIERARRSRTLTEAGRNSIIVSEMANHAAMTLLRERIGRAFLIGGF